MCVCGRPVPVRACACRVTPSPAVPVVRCLREHADTKVWRQVYPQESCYSLPGRTWESRLDSTCTIFWPGKRASSVLVYTEVGGATNPSGASGGQWAGGNLIWEKKPSTGGGGWGAVVGGGAVVG